MKPPARRILLADGRTPLLAALVGLFLVPIPPLVGSRPL